MTASTKFDSRNLDSLSLQYVVNDECRAERVPDALRRSRFTGPFEYDVFDKNGSMQTVTTGPGTDTWADLGAISPFVQVAVLTTEDDSFFEHHGFNRSAIRASLIADLKAHRFARGASTISMQLAKNLFLSREKTVSRKLEEVILAAYLEDTLSKPEIMELYLNVIEFGPDVYGIVSAADHYFGRTPAELNLVESLFLTSLLTSPIELHTKSYDKGGISPAWMNKLAKLMAVAHASGRISSAEVDEGLKEPLVFHRAGDAPVEPREPINESRVDLPGYPQHQQD